MLIATSKFPLEHPDRDLQCQENLEPAVQELIADANAAGWGTAEVLDALDELLRNLRLAYAEDPDPEDDPIMP
jgi:L-alanine-DL-glutamate epimerase-like enolase superfamily enzyme